MGLNTCDINNYDFITNVQEHLNIKLKPKSLYQKCPACDSSSSFIVNTNNTYKCHNMHCDLYKGGNLISFFKWAGYSYSETCQILGIKSESNKVNSSVRSFKLEQIFKETQKLLFNSPIALDYLKTRYLLTIEDLHKPYFSVGYTPGIPEIGFNLGEDRIIFPIRDSEGKLVHLHSRALDPNNNLRWKATASEFDGLPFTAYTWNNHLYLDNKELFLTEGISDGLILTKLGLPTISILSLTNNLPALLSKFKNLTRLTVIFDNDKLAYNVKDKLTYKSWDAINHTGLTVLERLLVASIENPNLTIWCVPPPDIVGVKDVNDWILKMNHTQDSFLQDVGRQAKLASSFAIEHYWNDKSKHKLVIKSLKDKASESLFLSKLVVDYKDWLDYLKEIV